MYIYPSFHRVRIKNGPGFLPRPNFFYILYSNLFLIFLPVWQRLFINFFKGKAPFMKVF